MAVRRAMVLSMAVMPMVLQAAQLHHRGNPIRKVVNMLQHMQEKVKQEGKSEQALFDKFMCYCSKAGGELETGIKAGKDKIESLSASIKSNREKKAQAESDLKTDQSSRKEAKDAMAEATALREKEAKECAAYEEQAKTNIGALAKAIPAIENGMSGSFLQTSDASMLRTFTMEKADLPDESRQELLAFLSGTSTDQGGEDYSPQSGQILGILKQMQDEMQKDLDESSATEADSVKTYEALIAAKTKELDTLTGRIEKQLGRIGNLGLKIASMENDLEDTEQSLGEDSKFLLELGDGCDKKKKEWAEIQKTRQEELVALSETIKILNDDDSLELFKKTLPSAEASFMQITVTTAALKARALASVQRAAMHRRHLPHRPEIDLIALALTGKKIGLDKIMAMIDTMVANLKKEQMDDDRKKEYCVNKLDVYEDKKKETDNSLKDSETAIEEMQGSIETLSEEIATLTQGIKDLDANVAEATRQRKAENAEYKDLRSSDTAAKEILLMAKNRLNKFYAPKLYRPEAGEPALFVQVSARSEEDEGQTEDGAPAPPPETFGVYSKKAEGQMGVTEMINLLVSDLDKELAAAEVNEKHAQKAYERAVAEAGIKRADDSKSISDKTAAKASEEQELEREEDTKASLSKELYTTLKFIHSLHGECDWLLKVYDARSDARAGEIDALVKAKAVLDGADFS